MLVRKLQLHILMFLNVLVKLAVPFLTFQKHQNAWNSFFWVEDGMGPSWGQRQPRHAWQLSFSFHQHCPNNIGQHFCLALLQSCLFPALDCFNSDISLLSGRCRPKGGWKVAFFFLAGAKLGAIGCKSGENGQPCSRFFGGKRLFCFCMI